MEYPKFYEDHIQNVIRQYNRARSKIANSAAFIFITDISDEAIANSRLYSSPIVGK